MAQDYNADDGNAQDGSVSPELRTDFSTLNAPSTLPPPLSAREKRTDLASLSAGMNTGARIIIHRTFADHMVDFLTPCMILIMTVSLLFYLLNVRYVYTAVHDVNLRIFAFSFILGVVALNRLIVRDGSNESILYIVLLVFAVCLYTVATTEMYGVGSVSRNFMNDSPWVAMLFNLAIVIFLWWMVNRLTHECCVDESPTAGDIGILTAMVDQARSAARPRNREWAPEIKASAGVHESWLGLESVDPSEPVEVAAPEMQAEIERSLGFRLPTGHPGMAVLFFSVPVMLIFSVGLRIIQHAGPPAVRMGFFYLMTYTFCALSLLMLSSLRQLRAYFNTRGVAMPSGIPWFWMGLGFVMVALMMWLAFLLPLPDLPPIAYVDYHQPDIWNPISQQFELRNVTPGALTLLDQFRFRERFEVVARMVAGLLLAYAVFKGLHFLAGYLARRKRQISRPLQILVTGTNWVLFHLWPAIKQRARIRPRLHIQADVALSARYDNPFAQGNTRTLSVKQHVEYAYEALRALATDVGKPPDRSHTPYEFLAAYPAALDSMREEAEELIRLYVIAAYSPLEMDERVEDRLRRFWQAFRLARNNYVW